MKKKNENIKKKKIKSPHFASVKKQLKVLLIKKEKKKRTKLKEEH